ncbi:hypothetical protein SMICM304S_05241 [Streptomyces microflavus]
MAARATSCVNPDRTGAGAGAGASIAVEAPHECDAGMQRGLPRTRQREVDIVGHSLGGLIARYYVQRLGGDRRVRTLVTLGTPHGGTAVAPGAGIHPIVRQMRGGSALMRNCASPPRAAGPGSSASGASSTR